jgi:hypothetical protein
MVEQRQVRANLGWKEAFGNVKTIKTPSRTSGVLRSLFLNKKYTYVFVKKNVRYADWPQKMVPLQKKRNYARFLFFNQWGSKIVRVRHQDVYFYHLYGSWPFGLLATCKQRYSAICKN